MSKPYLNKEESGNKALLNRTQKPGVVFSEPDRLGSLPGEYDGGSVAIPTLHELPPEVTENMLVRSVDRTVNTNPALARFVSQGRLSLMKRALSYVKVRTFRPLSVFIDNTHDNMSKLTFDYADYASTAAYAKLAAIANNTGDIYHPLFIRVAKLAIATKEAVVAASNDKSIFFLMEATEIYDRILKHFFYVGYAVADYMKLLKFRSLLPKIETGWPALYDNHAAVRDALRGENLSNGLDSVINTLGSSLTGAKYDSELLAEILSVIDYSLLPNQDGSLRVLHTYGVVSKVDAFVTPSTSTTTFLNHTALRTEVAFWISYLSSADIRDLESNLQAIGVIPSLTVPKQVVPFVNMTLMGRLNSSSLKSKGFLAPYRGNFTSYENYVMMKNSLARPTLTKKPYSSSVGVSNMFSCISTIVGSGAQPVLSYPEVYSDSVMSIRNEAIDSLPNNKARGKIVAGRLKDDFVWPRMSAYGTIVPTLVNTGSYLKLVMVGANYTSIPYYDPAGTDGQAEHTGAGFLDYSSNSLDDSVFTTTNAAFIMPTAVAKNLFWLPYSTDAGVASYDFFFFGTSIRAVGIGSMTFTNVSKVAVQSTVASTVYVYISNNTYRAAIKAAQITEFFFETMAASYGLNLPIIAVLESFNSSDGKYYSGPQQVFVDAHAAEKLAGATSSEPYLDPIATHAPIMLSFRDALTVDARIAFDLVSARYRMGVNYRRGIYVTKGL